MKPPKLEHLFSYSADIEQPQQGIGAGPFGHRMIARVTGGRVEGPRLNGEVLPGGGDWALIYASYGGVISPIDPETVIKLISGTIEPGQFTTAPHRLSRPATIDTPG